MNEIKNIIAKNLSDLRTENNMTQLELAEKLNYSDKAISKWERGESLPDITVLVKIADLFNVPLDCLVRETDIKKANNKSKYNYRIIKLMSEGLVWAIALYCFILTYLITKQIDYSYLYFVYALPLSLITSLVLNSIWLNKRKNYLIISGILWSVLLAIHLTFGYFGHYEVYPIYLLGIAGQLFIIGWSYIKQKK